MACYALPRLATVTLVNKYNALKEIDGCQSKKIWCGLNTLSHWLKKMKYLKQLKGKIMKTETYEDLDSVVYKWLKTVRHSNIPINCNIFKEKALYFAKSLDFHDFHASNGWPG